MNKILSGKEVEDLFIKATNNKQLIAIKATASQNMFSHIDFYINNEGYDVKAEKRFNRGDKSISSIIWIESKNVRGAKGWIEGDATYISFYREGKFYNFNRERLKERVYQLAPTTNSSNTKIEGYWYTRPGRKDKITPVQWDKIKDLITTIF